MLVRGVVAIVLLLLPAAAFAQTEKRIALLIGNQGYADSVGPLQNPHKDIALVGRALTDVGFNVLNPLKDAARDDMLFGVHELAVKLRQAGAGAIGLLYYTGHGVSVGFENVLVPKNVRNTSDAELDVRGVKLGEILDILKREAPDAVHFIVLDACHNNIRGKKGAKGFVAVNDYRTGVVLAFATAAGETAADEGATSGPYAAALAEEIVKPGHNDQMVFNAVRARVVAATRGQTPWTHDGLVGERIVFKAAAAEPAIGQRLGFPTPGGAMEVIRICREVEAMTSLSMLAVLERQHTGSPAADCISARIGELKTAQAAAAKAAEEQAKTEAAAKGRAEDEARVKAEAERQRLAMLEQQRQDEARKAAEAEAARRRTEAAKTPGTVLLRDSQEGIGLKGDVIASYAGVPIAKCWDDCRANQSCVAAEHDQEFPRCNLYSRVEEKIRSPRFTSFVRSNRGVKLDQRVQLFANTGLQGEVIESTPYLSKDDCKSACIENKGCVAAEHDEAFSRCTLFSSVARSVTSPRYTTFLVDGYILK